MNRFCVLGIIALCVSALAFATDLQFPGEGETIVLASHGNNAVGVYWSPAEQREYLFTYDGVTFTRLYQVPPDASLGGAHASMNSSGAYVGTIQSGPDLFMGFGSMCASLGCINSMVVAGYQLKGLTQIDVGGVTYPVKHDRFNNLWGLSIYDSGDILGWFSPSETVLLGSPFPDGLFLFHNGEAFFNYTIWDFDSNYNRIALYSEQQFNLADYAPIPEPSSILLLIPMLTVIKRIARRKSQA